MDEINFSEIDCTRYWDFIAEDLKEDEYIEIRGIHETKPPFINLTMDKYEFRNLCQNINTRYQVYAGIHPRKQDRKVSRVKFFVLDLDNPTDKDRKTLADLTDHIVLSGSGMHGYFPIGVRDIYGNLELRNQIQARNAFAIRKLQRLFQGKVDPAVSDPERCLGVPGTLNIKNGKMRQWL